MIDKIIFPIKVNDRKTSGVLYLHGKDVKLEHVTIFTKELFPALVPIYYTSFKDNGMIVEKTTFIRDSKGVVATSFITELHEMKLILKDNEYLFRVWDCQTNEMIRDYKLMDLAECVTTDILNELSKSKSDDDLFINMLSALYLIIFNRFLLPVDNSSTEEE